MIRTLKNIPRNAALLLTIALMYAFLLLCVAPAWLWEKIAGESKNLCVKK